MAKKLKKKAAKKAPAQKRAAAKKPATPKKLRYVYYFGDGKADGNGSMKPLLGGKGANLHEMTRIGLPVPPGFTITTEVCTYFYDNKKQYPPELEAQVATALAKIEKSVGKKLGGSRQPAFTVRSFRSARFDARNDGHDSESRNERRGSRDRGGEERQSSVRLGLLSSIPADVRRCRHGCAEARRGRSTSLSKRSLRK